MTRRDLPRIFGAAAALTVLPPFKGTIAVMQDPAALDFLADRGGRAFHVTGVCTGSLALGAAGLLRGYKATSHWYVRDLLPLMGASVADGRIVVDRNRVTAGGGTAGIDFALSLRTAARRRLRASAAAPPGIGPRASLQCRRAGYCRAGLHSRRPGGAWPTLKPAQLAARAAARPR